MRPPAAAAMLVACAATVASAAGPEAGHDRAARDIVIRGHAGSVLARVRLRNERFAVSYRNSIYGTLAEERYTVLPDGRYRLVAIAADQVAVLEEYYAVPGAPRRAAEADRRRWVVPADPARPTVLDGLSIAATDRGERTVHVLGVPPLELWRLVEDERPFVVLRIEGTHDRPVGRRPRR